MTSRNDPVRRVTLAGSALILLAWLAVSGAVAQQAGPSGADLAVLAAKRYPQAVQVNTLLHRAVLEPVESRRILGHVDEVIRLDSGKLAIVMTFGGLFTFGTHKIAVPLDAMALLGSELEVLDYTPQQLASFPTYDGGGTGLGGDEIIHMGLAHPSH